MAGWTSDRKVAMSTISVTSKLSAVDRNTEHPVWDVNELLDTPGRRTGGCYHNMTVVVMAEGLIYDDSVAYAHRLRKIIAEVE